MTGGYEDHARIGVCPLGDEGRQGTAREGCSGKLHLLCEGREWE